MNGFPCHPGHAPTLFRVAPGKTLSQLPMLINQTNYGLKLWLWNSATSAPDCLPPLAKLWADFVVIIPSTRLRPQWGRPHFQKTNGVSTKTHWLQVNFSRSILLPVNSMKLLTYFKSCPFISQLLRGPALQMKEGRFREVRGLYRNCTTNRMKCVDSQSERTISTVQEHIFHTMLPLSLGSDWQTPE